MAGMINSNLGPQQPRHYITQAQVWQLQKAFGDVELLVDLAELEDSSLNKVLKADSSLNAMQRVAVRHVLNSLRQ